MHMINNVPAEANRGKVLNTFTLGSALSGKDVFQVFSDDGYNSSESDTEKESKAEESADENSNDEEEDMTKRWENQPRDFNKRQMPKRSNKAELADNRLQSVAQFLTTLQRPIPNFPDV